MRKVKFFMSVIFILAALVACNSEEDGPVSGENGGDEGESRDKITWYMSDSSQRIPAESPMEIPTIQYLADKTNTDLDIQFLPHSDYISQLRLKFASEEFPDVYQNWGITEFDSEFIFENEQALPLNDLLKEHGQNLLEKIPDFAWDAVTIRGDIWAIPRPAYGNAPAERMMFVRGDWLKELDLDIPETSDQFLDMLRAFKTRGDDIIPFSMREDITWGTNLFGMWGLNWWDGYSLYEGEVIPDAIHPRMKKPLEFLNTMYEEGLLDHEFLTNASSEYSQKIRADRVGVWVHNTNLGWGWQKNLNNDSNEENPEAIVIPTPRGDGYDGPLGRIEQPVGRTYFIHKDAENPEAIIRLFDWLVTDEGQVFSELGIEGDTYEIVDGEYVYDEEKDKDQQSSFRSQLLRIHPYNEELTRVKEGEEAEEKLTTAYEIAREEGIPNITIGIPPAPSLYDLRGLFVETAAKIIVGDAPIDTFDDFVETWINNGGEEVISHMTEWYERLN